MRRVRSAALVGSFVFLAACSGSASPSPTLGGGAPLTLPSPSSSPTASGESPSATASEGASPSGGSPAPVAIHPCQLLTNEEASQVNGATYGDGTESDMGNGGLACVWQNSSVHASVTVQIVLASGITQAEQDYATAQAQSHGFAVENLSGIGDAAAIARAPAVVNTGGIYVRRGDTVFDVVYLMGTAPSDDQLKAAATTIIGELP